MSNINRKSLLKSKSKNNYFFLKYFNLALYVVIAGLGVFYLVNINYLTISGFTLRDLRRQARELANTNLQYKASINSEQSYYTLSNRTKNLNMVSIKNVDYLRFNDNVALAK